MQLISKVGEKSDMVPCPNNFPSCNDFMDPVCWLKIFLAGFEIYQELTPITWHYFYYYDKIQIL